MDKPKRLLFITQYFYPEVFRGNDIAFDFARRGVDVTVICGIPNYPEGKFYKGYGLFRRRKEVVNGVKVIRVPIVPRGNGNPLKVMGNYFSYFTVASLYLPFHLLFNKRYDACFIQQLSPVMLSVPGVLFKKLTGRKLYTWVLDLWPESLKAAGGIRNKFILNFFGGFATFQYKNADVIYVSSKGFIKNIAAKGDFSKKIDYLPNWAEDELLCDQKFDIPKLPKGFKILFAGNIGEAQDFDSIIETVKLLKPTDNIRFVIVGDGRKKDWVQQQIEVHNLSDRITLLGRYDMKYMPTFFKEADCLLLSLKDDEIMNLTVPAKLQAYMSSGKPIVAMINGESNKLVTDTGCGLCVPASSPQKLAECLRQISKLPADQLSQMGTKGRDYCLINFNKTRILDTLYNTIFSKNEK